MPIANWGLAQTPQSGFQSALAQGFQIGAQARQARERSKDRNALAAYVKDPNEQTFGGLADRRPEVAMQVQGNMQAQQAASQQAGVEGLEKFRPLLERAMQGPEEWALARQAALQSGYDMTGVPEQYDPEWAKGQMMILEASKDPEKLDRIGKAMRAFGYTDPTQPGFDQALQEFTRMTFARETTDEYGRPALLFPDVAPAGNSPAPMAQSQPMNGERAGQILQRASDSKIIMPDEAAAMRSALGPRGENAYSDWLRRNNIREVSRTGTAPDGRKVIQFADGTIEYAPAN